MELNMEKLKYEILDGLAPILELLLKEVLSTVLETFHENDPTNARLLMYTSYPAIDVKLQTLVEKSDTKLDDAAVNGVMGAFEKVAKNNNFELPNLDED